jgi:hypothetical protein
VRRVETTLARLDGVLRVKAGWRSDRATIVAEPGAAIDRERLNAALDGEFVVTALRRLR